MNIYGLLIGIGIFWGCQPTPHYTLQGNLDGFSGKVYLMTNDAQGIADTLGVTKAEGGKFQFRGIVGSPVYAWLQMEGKNLRVPILLENSVFQVSLNGEESKIDGGPLQTLRNEFRQTEKAIALQQDSLKSEYRKCVAAGNIFGKFHIRALMMDLDSIYEARENQFIAAHNNLAGAAIIREHLLDFSRQKTLSRKYDLLGDSARQTLLGKELQYYLEHHPIAEVGMRAPDFTSLTPEGASVSLYDVRAKVKIIDFWASWCGPCRAENPNVRRLYEKYHDKGLEIIGVSLDSKKEPWVKAIQKDGLKWLHVSDLKGWENAAAKMYGVKGIPHLLVLDSENRIVGEKLHGEELEKCVVEQLNN